MTRSRTKPSPALGPEHLARLVTASAYGGVCGVPALFPRRLFGALLALRGDRGAAQLLRGNPEVVPLPWSAGLDDIDRPADLGARVS